MAENKKVKDNPNKPEKRSILTAFLTKEKPDKDYFPDLKTQWQSMEQKERTQFVIGAIVGLIIIAGMLAAVYFVLVALRG
jgi:hypothetical protein